MSGLPGWMRVGAAMVVWRLATGVMLVLVIIGGLALDDALRGGVGLGWFEGVVLVSLSALYGWGHVLGSVECVYEKWESLDPGARERFRRAVPAAALWWWTYNAVLGLALALFASDQLPYRSPVAWVVAGLVWLVAVSTAPPLYRSVKSRLPAGRQHEEDDPGPQLPPNQPWR